MALKSAEGGQKECQHKMVFNGKKIKTLTKCRCTACGRVEIHEEENTKGDF